MKKKTIKIPIFKGDLILIKYKNTEKLKTKYKLEIPYSFGAIVFPYNKKSGYTRYVLAMRQTTIHQLAHEALHVAQMIMNDRGIEIQEVDETEAYLLAFVVEEAEKFFRRYL